MKFALFLGCKIPFHLKQYGLSTKNIFDLLGVELVDIEFNCCGYQLRHFNFEAFILSAARNMAMAEQQNLDILTPCKCCFGSLKYADHFLKKDDMLQKRINKLLDNENLKWTGNSEVKHLLSVLYHDVGIDTLKNQVKKPFKDLKVAASYGCHVLRPEKIVQFDNSLAPTIFENLVEITGAKSVQWTKRLECCGNPLWDKNSELSLNLMEKKISSASEVGADCLCTACTYCQIQFDTIQNDKYIKPHEKMPAVLYSQLLGLSLGLDKKDLGIKSNNTKIDALLNI